MNASKYTAITTQTRLANWKYNLKNVISTSDSHARVTLKFKLGCNENLLWSFQTRFDLIKTKMAKKAPSKSHFSLGFLLAAPKDNR